MSTGRIIIATAYLSKTILSESLVPAAAGFLVEYGRKLDKSFLYDATTNNVSPWILLGLLMNGALYNFTQSGLLFFRGKLCTGFLNILTWLLPLSFVGYCSIRNHVDTFNLALVCIMSSIAKLFTSFSELRSDCSNENIKKNYIEIINLISSFIEIFIFSEIAKNDNTAWPLCAISIGVFNIASLGPKLKVAREENVDVRIQNPNDMLAQLV